MIRNYILASKNTAIICPQLFFHFLYKKQKSSMCHTLLQTCFTYTASTTVLNPHVLDSLMYIQLASWLFIYRTSCDCSGLVKSIHTSTT